MSAFSNPLERRSVRLFHHPMVVVLLVLTTTFVFTTTAAQGSGCRLDLPNGTRFSVRDDEPFVWPDFCHKECTCRRSYPDFESGIPLFTISCGCSHTSNVTDDDNGNNVTIKTCLNVGERGVVPDLGLCTCEQNVDDTNNNTTNLPTLYCEDYTPTNEPTGVEAGDDTTTTDNNNINNNTTNTTVNESSSSSHALAGSVLGGFGLLLLLQL